MWGWDSSEVRLEGRNPYPSVDCSYLVPCLARVIKWSPLVSCNDVDTSWILKWLDFCSGWRFRFLTFALSCVLCVHKDMVVTDASEGCYDNLSTHSSSTKLLAQILSTQTPLAIGNMNTKADQNLHQNSFYTRGIQNHCNLFGHLNVIVFHSQQNFP